MLLKLFDVDLFRVLAYTKLAPRSTYYIRYAKIVCKLKVDWNYVQYGLNIAESCTLIS